MDTQINNGKKGKLSLSDYVSKGISNILLASVFSLTLLSCANASDINNLTQTNPISSSTVLTSSKLKERLAYYKKFQEKLNDYLEYPQISPKECKSSILENKLINNDKSKNNEQSSLDSLENKTQRKIQNTKIQRLFRNQVELKEHNLNSYTPTKIAIPNSVYSFNPKDPKCVEDKVWLARMLIGEARSESYEYRETIAYVVINRMLANPNYYGKRPKDVILKSKQFSCFNKGDPNRKVALNPEQNYSDLYKECLQIAEKVLKSKTLPHKATHYHNSNVNPRWSGVEKLFTLPYNYVKSRKTYFYKDKSYK